MPKLLFARELQDHEQENLERIIGGDNAVLRQRALIVLLSAEERYRVPEIAPMVGLHVDKVRKWISRFNKYGMKGLQPTRRKPGPRGKFDSVARDEIVKIASTPPRHLGQLRTVWTLDSLRKYLCDNNIISEISRESLRQILIGEDINWQRPRSRSNQTARWLNRWQSTPFN